MTKTLFLFAAALALPGCQKAADAPAVTPTQADAEKIVAATEASFASGKADEILSHYADGAVMFDPGILAPVTDRQIQARLTQGFVGMQPGDFTVADRHVQPLDSDTIVASGVMSFTAQTGASRQRVSTRYTDVYEKQPDGRWLIVHEHMSLPPSGPSVL